MVSFIPKEDGTLKGAVIGTLPFGIMGRPSNDWNNDAAALMGSLLHRSRFVSVRGLSDGRGIMGQLIGGKHEQGTNCHFSSGLCAYPAEPN